MTHYVFVGTWRVSAKSGMNKSIARFPDVCLSPPSPPAGPIPVPYPDTSFSTDLKKGSKKVKIAKKGAALAQQSFYKAKMLGDEAATRSFGAGVISHSITGKSYFKSWAFDVKYEGKSVCRHIDLTTSNSMCDPANEALPAPTAEDAAPGSGDGGPPPSEEGPCDKTAPCPCCKRKECPSAIRRQDKTMTEDEYYSRTPGTAARWGELKTFMADNPCTCTTPDTKVLAQPPCNVFRDLTNDPCGRTSENIKEDGGYNGKNAKTSKTFREEFLEDYARRTGTPMKSPAQLKADVFAEQNAALRKGMSFGLPKGTQVTPAISAAFGRLRKGEKKSSPFAHFFKALDHKASELAKINHVVPTSAGGCPTNPGNLQPMQALCSRCQLADEFMTKHLHG